MLPPVRTLSNSSMSFQGQPSLTSSGHLAADVSIHVASAEADGEINSHIAGKLNILLLAGRERMADNLSFITDAIGKAINLPRLEGETSIVYAARLAEAFQTLNPEQRAVVEKLLNKLVQGLQLRFLTEALKNPTGQEAARIVAYLEMARYKERDQMARSVVTSYRQNSGVDHQPGGMPAAAGQASPTQPSVPSPAAAGNGSPVPGEASVANSSHSIDQAQGEDSMKTERLIERRMDGEGALDDKSGHTPARSSISDARSLQTILNRAFDIGESSDAAITAKANAEMLGQNGRFGKAAEADTGGAPTPGNGGVTMQPASGVQSPDAALARGAAADAAEPHQTMLVLKGWMEVAALAGDDTTQILNTVLDNTLVVSAEAMKKQAQADEAAEKALPAREAGALARMVALDVQGLVPDMWGAGETAPSEKQMIFDRAVLERETANGHAGLPDMAQADDSYAAARLYGQPTAREASSPTADQARAGEAPSARPEDRPEPQTSTRQQSQTAERALQQPVLFAGQQIPYAVVNYLPAQDMLPEERDEARQRSGDDGEAAMRDGNDDADTAADDQEAPAEEQAFAAVPEDDTDGESTETGSGLGYDIYQRSMAGWA